MLVWPLYVVSRSQTHSAFEIMSSILIVIYHDPPVQSASQSTLSTQDSELESSAVSSHWVFLLPLAN